VRLAARRRIGVHALRRSFEDGTERTNTNADGGAPPLTDDGKNGWR
jgi:hypothetical protein